MQPSNDPYKLLLQIYGETKQTSAKLELLLGDNGELSRIREDIERLYQRDKECLDRADALELQVRSAARSQATTVDRFRGAWLLVSSLSTIAALVLILMQLLNRRPL